MAAENKVKEAQASLERIQQFDVNTLMRSKELGEAFSFAEAIPNAQAVIDLYKRISIGCLDDFAEPQLDLVKGQANSDYQLFQKILTFTPTENNAIQERVTLINQLSTRRDTLFNNLWQFIAYSVARTTDISLFESQARGVIQSIKDQTAVINGQLEQNKKDSDDTLKAIRAVAAEQGVSQKAMYFKDEFDQQETKAAEWLEKTYWFAAALAAFSIVSLFLHKWEWLAPKGEIEAIQFISSKIVIFAVLAFLLIMSSRNYNSHKHNAVLNKHRQNALLTYSALVAAAGEKGTEDIVLANAASCIFSPQETGYTGIKGESTSPKSVLELMTKSSSKSAD